MRVLWTLLLAVGLGLNWLAAAFEPVPVVCGQVVGLALVGQPAGLEWDPETWGARPEVGEGQTFAIVTVRLAPGRSIGKFDFLLAGAPCLATARGDAPLSPANWEHVERPGRDQGQPVRLLYRVTRQEGLYEFSLRYAIPTLAAAQRSVSFDEHGAPRPPAPPEAVPALASPPSPTPTPASPPAAAPNPAK